MNSIQRVTQGPLKHPLVAGVFYGFIWLALEALALSILLSTGSAGEDNLVRYTYLVHSIACLFGGFTSGRRSGKKGWYFGGITGVIYMLLVLIIAFLAVDVKLGLDKWLLVLAAFAVGSLGGIIGVNMKKGRK
ncbi:TIGR04086 family membrane protein [Paenibacillus marinisediminis]